MTNTICGHDRNALMLALEDLAHIDNTTVVELARLPEALPAWRGAVLDLIDPAKLAAMMAKEGRRLGFDAWLDVPGERYFTDPPKSTQLAIFWTSVRVEAYAPKDLNGRLCALPQARAILLQWLQLPDGAREEAEKVLRGAT